MTDNHTAHYAPFFKAWQGKVLGSKPTTDQLGTMHGLRLRPGKQALACSMALRPEGVTGAQIVMACGAPQLNRMRGLIASGYVKREAVPASPQGHTVYKITLTPRGEAAIKRYAVAADKAALAPAKPAKKGKAKRKPRPAPTVTASEPAPVAPVDPAPVNEPASEAPQPQA